MQVVKGNVEENFSQCQTHVGVTVTKVVFDEVVQRSRKQLVELKVLLEHRVAMNAICDAHGDLRLEHIYNLPDGIGMCWDMEADGVYCC